MKRTLLSVICLLFVLTSAVSAQDVIIRSTPTPEVITEQSAQESVVLVNQPVENPVVTPEADMIVRPVTIAKPAAGITAEQVQVPVEQTIVRRWDPSLYVNQPKSVNLPNATERFASGLEVPKPDLDRPITDAWDDLKQGYACEAILNRPYYFEQMAFGQEFTLDITFRNVGTQTWDFNIDLMMYTGDQLEKHPGENVYDIWKDVGSDDKNTHIVKPGQSIRVTLPMRAPDHKYHDDNKYYAAYTLVRNWNLYGWDELHSGQWDREDGNALFCPVYFYIYVPE